MKQNQRWLRKDYNKCFDTYHVEQTWRATRSKKVVSHYLEIHLNLPKTNSPKEVVRATQSWSVVSYVNTKGKKRSLGVTSDFYFEVEGKKIKIDSKLSSFSVTGISQSSPNKTCWFIEVRHQHLKTYFQGFLSHVHILIYGKLNLKQVFGPFSCFFRTLIAKISSSEEPANTLSNHRVRNLAYSFIPHQKLLEKVGDSPVENPRKRGDNIRMAQNGQNFN